MNLSLLGTILTVTGVVGIVVTQTRGANLNISRRTGLIASVSLLIVGMALLIFAFAQPH